MTVDLDAIRDNVAELHAGRPGAGHGRRQGRRLRPRAGPRRPGALDGGATWLGVAQLAEALELRDAGVTAPVLTWLFVPGATSAGAIDADIDVTVGGPWTLDAVVAAAREPDGPPASS